MSTCCDASTNYKTTTWNSQFDVINFIDFTCSIPTSNFLDSFSWSIVSLLMHLYFQFVLLYFHLNFYSPAWLRSPIFTAKHETCIYFVHIELKKYFPFICTRVPGLSKYKIVPYPDLPVPLCDNKDDM